MSNFTENTGEIETIIRYESNKFWRLRLYLIGLILILA